MKKFLAILFISTTFVGVPALTVAADTSTHNPTGDDKVEEGWKQGGCGSRSGCGSDDKQQKTSTDTDKTEKYGKQWLEEQVQGTKEPKVNRTY